MQAAGVLAVALPVAAASLTGGQQRLVSLVASGASERTPERADRLEVQHSHTQSTAAHSEADGQSACTKYWQLKAALPSPTHLGHQELHQTFRQLSYEYPMSTIVL
jgi:hypothetical protein